MLAQRYEKRGRGLVVLQATDNLVGLVLDAFGSVRQLVLSLGGDLVGLALVSYVLVVGSFAVGFLCLAYKAILLVFHIAHVHSFE